MTPAHRDRILADYPQAQPKLFLLAEYATGEAEEVLDALGQSPPFYAEVFQQLRALIPRGMEK
jgi:protein-tyrosine phosphatase